jgi:hypothetical protein
MLGLSYPKRAPGRQLRMRAAAGGVSMRLPSLCELCLYRLFLALPPACCFIVELAHLPRRLVRHCTPNSHHAAAVRGSAGFDAGPQTLRQRMPIHGVERTRGASQSVMIAR